MRYGGTFFICYLLKTFFHFKIEAARLHIAVTGITSEITNAVIEPDTTLRFGHCGVSMLAPF